MRPLRVAVQLPGSERRAHWTEYTAMAAAAEEVGFDSLRLGDHLLYRDDGRPERGPLEMWTLLSALAATTSRIHLGPLVACTAFHPPGVIAKMAATIDEISGGRLVLGLGCGWNEPEFDAFGLPFSQRVARFEEALRIVRGLLAGERVSLAGKFWTVREAVLLPAPQRRIPLMIGSNGDRMLELGLPQVDGWNLWYSDYGNTLEGYAKAHAKISTAAERAGREPGSITRSVGVLAQQEDPGTGSGSADADRPCALAGLAEHLRSLARAGADEAVIIMHTMNEQAIRALGPVLTALDDGDSERIDTGGF